MGPLRSGADLLQSELLSLDGNRRPPAVRTAGINLEKLTLEDHDFHAVPLVNAKVAFLGPARIGNFVTRTIWISRWRAKAFDIEHRFSIRENLLVRVKQVRVWARVVPDNPESLRAIPVLPDDVQAALSEDSTVTLRMTFEEKSADQSSR